MFEDLIKKKIGPVPVSKDSLIESLKHNVKLKDKHIKDLLSEIVKRGNIIDNMKKELDYLTDL